jgi:hypothetical protein
VATATRRSSKVALLPYYCSKATLLRYVAGGRACRYAAVGSRSRVTTSRAADRPARFAPIVLALGP